MPGCIMCELVNEFGRFVGNTLVSMCLPKAGNNNEEFENTNDVAKWSFYWYIWRLQYTSEMYYLSCLSFLFFLSVALNTAWLLCEDST